MKCKHCGIEHPLKQLCDMSRRSFISYAFIGGGAALGITLAPSTNFWEPYKVKCGSCAGYIMSHSKEIIKQATPSPVYGHNISPFALMGDLRAAGVEYDETHINSIGRFYGGKPDVYVPNLLESVLKDPTREHHIEFKRRRFTGTIERLLGN